MGTKVWEADVRPEVDAANKETGRISLVIEESNATRFYSIAPDVARGVGFKLQRLAHRLTECSVDAPPAQPGIIANDLTKQADELERLAIVVGEAIAAGQLRSAAALLVAASGRLVNSTRSDDGIVTETFNRR